MSEVELVLVMKKIVMRMISMMLVMSGNGRFFNMLKSIFFGGLIMRFVLFICCWMVVVLKIVNYMSEMVDGMMMMMDMNWCSVWLCEIFVMNMLMNGD